MPIFLYPSVDVLAGTGRSRGLAGEPVNVAAVQAYFEAMSPADLDRFVTNLNQVLDSIPMGARVRASANSKRLGLGLFEAAAGAASSFSSSIAAIATGLVTEGLKLGVDLYDKKQDNKAAAAADKRAYNAQLAQVKAMADQQIKETQVRATTWGKYALYGALGVGLLTLVGFIAMRRR